MSTDLGCVGVVNSAMTVTGTTVGYGDYWPSYQWPSHYLPPYRWPDYYPVSCPVYVPVPAAPLALPTSVGGWTVVGHCHKCGNPVYARPSLPRPLDDKPETVRSCECH